VTAQGPTRAAGDKEHDRHLGLLHRFVGGGVEMRHVNRDVDQRAQRPRIIRVLIPLEEVRLVDVVLDDEVLGVRAQHGRGVGDLAERRHRRAEHMDQRHAQFAAFHGIEQPRVITGLQHEAKLTGRDIDNRHALQRVGHGQADDVAAPVQRRSGFKLGGGLRRAPRLWPDATSCDIDGPQNRENCLGCRTIE
jgi:hypothetical protein